MHDPRFRTDLYSGTAQYYERFRPGYPVALIQDLTSRIRPTGAGKLLDLACGTGQIAFALQDRFEEIWAVDQEPDMVAACREKVTITGKHNVHCIQSSAEDLSVPDDTFELIGIGNAFHRLDRKLVAARCRRWLGPRGHLALLWGGTPWRGPEGWQVAMSSLLDRWTPTLGAQDRTPCGHEEARSQLPDLQVLAEAGFDVLGRWEFTQGQWWTPESLIGFVYSTSFLSVDVLGERAEEFEEDLRQEVCRFESDGRLYQTVTFACEVARRPD